MWKNEVKYCRKFGLDFVTNFPSLKFDDLYNWAHNVLGVPNICVGQCKWFISKLCPCIILHTFQLY